MKRFEESREADFLCNWLLNNVGFGALTPCAVENSDAKKTEKRKFGCKRPRFDPWVRKIPWRRK